MGQAVQSCGPRQPDDQDPKAAPVLPQHVDKLNADHLKGALHLSSTVKVIPLLQQTIQRARKQPGGYFKDRADLNRKWPADLSDFLFVDETNISQNVFVDLKTKGVRLIPDTSTASASHEATMLSLKGHQVVQLQIHPLAKLVLREPEHEYIMARVHCNDAPEIDDIVRHLRSAEEVSLLLQRLVEDNVTHFTIELCLEQLKMSFEKSSVVDDYCVRMQDDPEAWPKCWPIHDVSFVSWVHCEISAMSDPIEPFLHNVVARRLPPSQVASTMHGEGYPPMDIERFLLMCDPAEKMGSTLKEIIKAEAPFKKFMFSVDEELSTKLPSHKNENDLTNQFKKHVDKMDGDLNLMGEEEGPKGGDLSGNAIGVTLADGIEALLVRLRHGVRDVDDWLTLLSWEPLQIKTIDGSLHLAKRLKAMGDPVKSCQVIAAAIDLILKEKRNAGLKASLERNEKGGSTKTETPREMLLHARSHGYCSETVNVKNHQDMMKIVKSTSTKHIVEEHPFANSHEICVGDRLILPDGINDTWELGCIPKDGYPVALSVLRKGILRRQETNFIISSIRDSITLFFNKFAAGQNIQSRFESQIASICSKTVLLIDEVLLPPALERHDHESISLFLKTKADYIRYMFLHVPSKRCIYPIELIHSIYSQALEASKNYSHPSSLTVMTTAINAAVASAELDRNHRRAAKICRDAFREAMDEQHRQEELIKKKAAASKKDNNEELPEAVRMNLSEQYNFHLLEGNTLALESSIFLISVAFIQDDFLAEINQMDPLKPVSKEQENEGDEDEAKSSAKKAPLPWLSIPSERKKGESRMCQAPCSDPCEEVETDQLKDDEFGEAHGSGDDVLLSTSIFSMEGVPEKGEEDGDDGLIPATPQEIEIVRRWVCKSEIHVEQDAHQQREGRDTPFGHPSKFNWLDHVEVYSSALAHKHGLKSPQDGHHFTESQSEKEGKAHSAWSHAKNAYAGVVGVAGKHMRAQRTWLLACVCKHMPGEVPTLSNTDWQESVVDSLLKEDHKDEAQKKADLKTHVKSSSQTKLAVGCRRHTFKTKGDLDRLMHYISSYDGEVKTQAHLSDGILLVGDKLLLVGPLTGSVVADVPRLRTPTKLTFQLKECKLKARTIVPVISGPYVEVHQLFHNFRGNFLRPHENFLGLFQVLEGLEAIQTTGLWDGYPKKPGDEGESDAKQIPCLSARRNPQQASDRGVK